MDGEKEILTIEAEIRERYLMFSKSPSKTPSWKDTRKKWAILTLTSWNRITEEKDIFFDPDNKPELNVRPLKKAGLPPGSEPSDIKDPFLRIEYLDAIEKNNLERKYYDKQFQIRKLENEYNPIAIEYLVKLYSMHPKTLDEINDLLELHLENSDLKDDIMTAINLNW